MCIRDRYRTTSSHFVNLPRSTSSVSDSTGSRPGPYSFLFGLRQSILFPPFRFLIRNGGWGRTAPSSAMKNTQVEQSSNLRAEFKYMIKRSSRFDTVVDIQTWRHIPCHTWYAFCIALLSDINYTQKRSPACSVLQVLQPATYVSKRVVSLSGLSSADEDCHLSLFSSSFTGF